MRVVTNLRATIHGLSLCLVPLALVAALFGTDARNPAAAQQNSAFVPGIEDLPLMPGLKPVEPASTYFDSPAGRIVIAYAGMAAAPLDRPAILSFYAQALPQLGWTRLGDADYRRDGESLRIEVGDARPPLVRFTLSPQ
jgi:hypothetical protein